MSGRPAGRPFWVLVVWYDNLVKHFLVFLAVLGTVFYALSPLAAESAPSPLAAESAPSPLAAEPVPSPLAAEYAVSPAAAEYAPSPLAAKTAPSPLAAEYAASPAAAEPAPSPLAAGGQKTVFWRYTLNRHGNAVLTDPLEVPEGEDPFAFLASQRGFDKWLLSRGKKAFILSEKAVSGEVPVLCFHKIGRQERFALTPERFRRLLRYLKKDGWYMVSDYQYLQGDFSRVPTGLKPIVMGADDGGHNNIEYQVYGDSLTGRIRPFAEGPRMERNCMAYILEKLAPREEGRINFTFYVSFDAIPFRQLGGQRNPGFPYRGISVVEQKIRYLDENFILGIHSLSHEYVYSMGIDAFAEDILRAWEILDDYAGGRAETVRALAFPYGVGEVTADVYRKLSALSRNGRFLAGAFDLDGGCARPPGNLGNRFDVSRINVDNEHWNYAMAMLENADAVKARRDFIWESSSKRLPPSPYRLGAAPSDQVWVLVRPGGG